LRLSQIRFDPNIEFFVRLSLADDGGLS
jgi:hypothetical protein